MAYEDFHYSHYVDDHRGGYNAAADRTENRQLVYKTVPPYIYRLDRLAERLWTLNGTEGRAAALYRQCEDYIFQRRLGMPSSGCLRGMTEEVKKRWSTRSDSFCKAFAVRYAMYHYNRPKHMTKEPEMSTEKTFHPHTVIGVLVGIAGNYRFTYDPEFFKVKKGDIVVVNVNSNPDGDVFSGLRVAMLTEEPTSWEGTTLPHNIVDRLDMEQYAVRKEQTAKRARARALLHEAAKRTTEADLFDRVKGKLTDEEAALIKEALGYGDAPAAAAG